MSETSNCRPWLSRFCTGTYGLDIGAGGDPIFKESVMVDCNAACKPDVVCDAAKLPFLDNTFQYVFSSHCLEDFEDTGMVLNEWLRVLEPQKNLVLFLPDQKLYEAHCKENNVLPNQDHKHPNFGPDYLMQFLDWEDVIYFERRCTYNPYSWAIVIKKP